MSPFGNFRSHSALASPPVLRTAIRDRSESATARGRALLPGPVVLRVAAVVCQLTVMVPAAMFTRSNSLATLQSGPSPASARLMRLAWSVLASRTSQ